MAPAPSALIAASAARWVARPPVCGVALACTAGSRPASTPIARGITASTGFTASATISDPSMSVATTTCGQPPWRSVHDIARAGWSRIVVGLGLPHWKRRSMLARQLLLVTKVDRSAACGSFTSTPADCR
jgi:hypothetical protein